MGCMLARRLGLSSCAMLFLCGIFGGFLLGSTFLSSPSPSRPMPRVDNDQDDLGLETAHSSRSAAGSFDGTGGGTGGDASGAAGGKLSAPSGPLPPPDAKEELDTFEPVIRAPLDVKTLSEGKIPRPRFYSQELGTHQKLYLAVLTSPETVHREAVNINHTLGHITSSIGFFMVGEPNLELPKNLHNVVIFPTETGADNLPMKTAEYVASHYGNMYDFFFIVRDNTYVRGYRLKELAEELSVSTDVLLGARHGDSCKLDGGLLLSRQLLVYTSERKAECAARQQTTGYTGDRALISCLELLGNMRCSDRAQGKWFVSQLAQLYDPTSDGDLPGLVSIQAVHTDGEHSRLHAAFSRLEIAQIDERIDQLRRALDDNQRNRHALGRRTKAGEDAGEFAGEAEQLPWPTGSPAPVRTASMHHINMWQRFSETDMYLRTQHSVVDTHSRVDRLDIQDVMELGMKELEKTAPLRLVGLRAGYRRFDGTRGMDYILDLEVQPKTGGATQIRRAEVHRPILKAELVPIPFVTEKPTVSIVLPVQPDQTARAYTFVQELISKNENVALMLVLIPGDSDTSVFDSLRKLVKQANDRRSAQSSHRFETVVWPHRTPPSQFDIVDMAGEQSRGRWQQALVLLLSDPLEFNSELLNRARMQTIRRWEVFSPIPWVEYYPDVGYFGTSNLQPSKLELRKAYGHFDGEHYAILSFYMDDYKAVREQTLADVPAGVPPSDSSDSLQPYDLYGAFVKFSGLHVHRAIDPSFRLYYFERTCPAPPKYFHQMACENSRLHGLGPHDKVSKLLADYRRVQGDDSRHVNAI